MPRFLTLRRIVRPLLPPIVLDAYRRRRPPTPLQVARELAPFRLPQRTLHDLYNLTPTETVQIPLSQVRRFDVWTVPAAELLSLAAICHVVRPKRIFEFGTYTGASTLVMALNTPDETDIITVDLDPAARDTHQHGTGVGGFHDYTVGGDYQGHAAAQKITQLYGNLAAMELSQYEGTIDLVYVDADHSYEFVKKDTATALRLLRPGGTIIWDDYIWTDQHPECAGVTRVLNDLAASRQVYRLAGTRFAIYVDKRS